MAPCNGTQLCYHVHSPKVGRHPPPPTIAQWQWHPAMAPSTPPKLCHPPPNHSTLQWQPTMAPSNGTTSTAPCNCTLVPRPTRQNGSSPSPLLEVTLRGKNHCWFSLRQRARLNLHPTCLLKIAQTSPDAHSYLQNCINIEKIFDHVHLHFSFAIKHLYVVFYFCLSTPKTFGQANQQNKLMMRFPFMR